MERILRIFQNFDELSRFAAERFVEIGSAAIKKHGRFSVALAGGSTPKPLYRMLSTDEFRKRLEWQKVLFFFGDERNVPPDDEKSNFRMAKKNLFEPLHIPSENVFRWKTEIEDAEKAAEIYEREIRDFFDLEKSPTAAEVFSGSAFPRFDLILLGMGADGHTASLFPGSGALKETKKIAAANRVEKLDSFRLTLTFPVINNAANVMFLVSGEEKAETLQTVIEGEFEPDKYPAQLVVPENGELFWLVDSSAASLLNA